MKTMEMMHRRTLLKSAFAAGGALSFLSPAQLLAAVAEDPRLANVHPEYRAFAKQMLAQLDKQKDGPMSMQTLPKSRAMMKQFASPRRDDVPVEKRVIPGMKGQPDVTVFLINAGKEGQRPAIVHTHGGGFVSGTAEGFVRNIQDLCKELDCAAVSVEYRLAPETTYAGSIEDNYAALKWVHGNAAQLGVDPRRIAVMGESAGGGHAALLAIAARDRGEVPVAFQCLIYPMLDDRTGTTRAVPPHIAPFMWGRGDNRFGWQSFLGMEPGTSKVPVRAVPARQTNLRGLPPAFIGVGSIDLFLDEDIEYARRLNDAGVTAELLVVPGCFHGFDSMPVKTRVGTWFNEAKVNALRLGLGISTNG
ncbi:Alpha/beta hydrolase domain-containing protein precursor [Sphingomonas paucimobilis]|nr:Alpha/beta hydrolase domain-containing protein precursor [Sphingomonas paucimobilis]